MVEIRVEDSPGPAEEAKAFTAREWRRWDEVSYDPDSMAAWDMKGGYRAGFTLTARQDDELVGVVSGWVSEGVAYVNEVLVSPDRRGQGIGTRLLEAMEELCLGRGAYRLALRVEEKASARRLYERLGWWVELTVDDWLGGKTYVQMRKDLQPGEAG